MYVSKLSITDLRTIHKCTIDLCVPVPVSDTTPVVATEGPLSNVTLLLGINGAGKTTILRALAMAVLAPLLPQSSGFVPRTMVRRRGNVPAAFAEVSADLIFNPQDGVSMERATSSLKLTPLPESYQDRFEPAPEPEWAKGLWKERSPSFFLVGYGASRRIDSKQAFFQAQEQDRNLRYFRVAGLFEESVVMRPLSSWLPQWDNPGRRKQLIAILNSILPEVDLVDEPVDGDYLFRMAGAELPFSALSDGYRAFIGWITDLLYHISRGTPHGEMLFETAGMVLVDEVDLHLHPAWQRTVIPRLARAMPNLQFVFTSHSPLVVGTLYRENIRVIKLSDEGSIVEPAKVEVHGLSSDQILTSEYFGLESTREPGFARELNRMARDARSGDADSAEQFVRMLSLGSDATSRPKR
jgi:hypothetical protein